MRYLFSLPIFALLLAGATSTRTEGIQEEECSVCLLSMDSDKEMQLSGCDHRFHAACVLRALTFWKGCPICRKTPEIKVCEESVRTALGLGISYIDGQGRVMLAVVCSETNRIQGPIEHWEESRECPKWDFDKRKIQEVIDRRCLHWLEQTIIPLCGCCALSDWIVCLYLIHAFPSPKRCPYIGLWKTPIVSYRCI